MSDQHCPLCGEVPELVRHDFDCWFVDCERCGHFQITFEARTNLNNLGPDHRTKLSAYCRRVSQGNYRPIIEDGNIEELIGLLPQYTPREQLDNLLHVLGKMSPGLGKACQFAFVRDYPLVSTSGGDEIPLSYDRAARPGISQ